jgi:ribonuclease D
MLQICQRLRAAEMLALDVETCPATQQLALVQVGLRGSTYLIDVLAVGPLEALIPILGPDGPLKLIHNARFEQRILGANGVLVDHIFDTMRVSQKRHGKIAGGHSLAAACDRELGCRIDKTQQCSAWLIRPLTRAQLVYAALDAEILFDLHDALIAPPSQPVEDEV